MSAECKLTFVIVAASLQDTIAQCLLCSLPMHYSSHTVLHAHLLYHGDIYDERQTILHPSSWMLDYRSLVEHVTVIRYCNDYYSVR